MGKGVIWDVTAGGDAIMSGGDEASDNLLLRSTEHATKGFVGPMDGETLKPQSTAAFILPQTGAGAPSHTAPEGQQYFDTTNNVLYQNVSAGSGTTWAKITAPHAAEADPHSVYALLAGRSGGQTLIGGTGSGDDLTLEATSHATEGDVIVDSRVFDLRTHAVPLQLMSDDAQPTGTTDLDIGALIYRADALALATAHLNTWMPDYMRPRVWDDFIYGSVGKMPWEQVAIGTGTLALIAGEADHPGILRFDGNDTDSGYVIHRGLTTVVHDGFAFCAMLVRFDSTAAAQHLSAGLGNSTTTTDDTSAVGFVISAATKISGRCRNAGTQTLTATDFTFAADTWYWLVWYTSGSGAVVTFAVLTADGTLGADLGAVLSNVPTGVALGPNVRWRTTNATDKMFDLGAYVFAVHNAVTPLRKT